MEIRTETGQTMYALLSGPEPKVVGSNLNKVCVHEPNAQGHGMTE